MKIQKKYMVLCFMLLSMQTIYSQENMHIEDNNDNVYEVKIPSVKYSTFNANNNWFTFTNDSVESLITPTDSIKGTYIYSLTISCSVGLSAESEVKKLTTTPEVGICYSKDHTMPTVDFDDCQLLGSQLKSYMLDLPYLVSGTTYYYRVYVKLANGVFYGDVAQAKTLGMKPNDKIINGHKFLDLELPSGLLWAETNIGAETAADDGNYYAWGETEPQISKCYDWDSYKYSTKVITKYNDTDSLTTLEPTDDAAYVNWGEYCRMPTVDEFSELCNYNDNCDWFRTNMKNSDGSSVKGYKVVSRKNGNSIFLPFSGHWYMGNLGFHGSYGEYWSSSKATWEYHAFKLHTYGTMDYGPSDEYRWYGYTVRPVAHPQGR